MQQKPNETKFYFSIINSANFYKSDWIINTEKIFLEK